MNKLPSLEAKIFNRCFCFWFYAPLGYKRYFVKGGGGEKLKAKAKALETAEKANDDGTENKLKWTAT